MPATPEWTYWIHRRIWQWQRRMKKQHQYPEKLNPFLLYDIMLFYAQVKTTLIFICEKKVSFGKVTLRIIQWYLRKWLHKNSHIYYLVAYTRILRWYIWLKIRARCEVAKLKVLQLCQGGSYFTLLPRKRVRALNSGSVIGKIDVLNVAQK